MSLNIVVKFKVTIMFFKGNHILISPAVENPICRIPLRPEIYTKAAQLRILNTPGSKIEDRQYELTTEISLCTSNWNEIVGMMNSETMPQNYDNPAFEWNNLHNIQKCQNFNVQTIFQDFKISAIYAPSIRFKSK